jgi:hypothetical protein
MCGPQECSEGGCEVRSQGLTSPFDECVFVMEGIEQTHADRAAVARLGDRADRSHDAFWREVGFDRILLAIAANADHRNSHPRASLPN